jgi:hypothetical protein
MASTENRVWPSLTTWPTRGKAVTSAGGRGPGVLSLCYRP